MTIQVTCPEGATMTPISEILRNVTYSCDFPSIEDYPGETPDEQQTNFWIDVIKTKAGDSGFGHLIDSLLEEGWHGSAVGWYNDSEITEGHHRLVAGILLGLDAIPTTALGRCGDHPPREGMRNYFSAHASCQVDKSIRDLF